MDTETADRIRQKATELRSVLATPEISQAAQQFAECRSAVNRLKGQIEDIEARLSQVPPIEVCVLGPSRHGKSTLLNAISGEALLPTSDIKPCTASIVRLTWAEEWSVKIRFVSKESLGVDWKRAVKDARDFILREQEGDAAGASVEDQKSFQDGLARFIELFRIDKTLPPTELVARVETASIPAEYAKYIGQNITAPQKTLEELAQVIRHYLSTSNVCWTLVEECEICGPFQDWHPSLSVVDLPGTNDTNPHRTAITNRVRDTSQAVAVVTQDSNIGPDIESWLRESSVLSEFIEARDRSRQRLFVVRTQIDSYVPQVEHAENDEEWERLEKEAIENYKDRQTETYREMLRDLILTRLSNAKEGSSEERRRHILDRVESIEVHFVSALAHEAFAGRVRVGPRDRRSFEDRFGNDVEQTGIPELRRYLVRVAERYLAENYYDDLLATLEREAGLLARYFRRELDLIDARINGGATSLTVVTQRVRQELVPWSQQQSVQLYNDFEQKALRGNDGINGRLSIVDRLATRRLEDKLVKWQNYAWSSLRATGRKGGVHTTARGHHIDIVQDICSVLVDDVLLAWTDYRDSLIDQGFQNLTSEYTEALLGKLQEMARLVDDSESANALQSIMLHLADLTESQRHETLRRLEQVIRQHESIRRPIYDRIQQRLRGTFESIGQESGVGCAVRMRDKLATGFNGAIGEIREHVRRLIDSQVKLLLQATDREFQGYGSASSTAIVRSIKNAEEEVRDREEGLLQDKRAIASKALQVVG